jgi:hypothetical protein
MWDTHSLDIGGEEERKPSGLWLFNANMMLLGGRFNAEVCNQILKCTEGAN